MNPRILCLWFPNWPIQRVAVDRPELRGKLVALHRQDPRRGQLVAACSAAARRSEIRIGMPLSEAKSLAEKQQAVHELPAAGKRTGNKRTEKDGGSLQVDQPSALQKVQPHFIPHDPEQDRETLESLADQCDIFSPIVGLETGQQPSCLYLDITGLERLFRQATDDGERHLAEQIHDYFSHLGYWPCITVAPTIGLAAGLKRTILNRVKSSNSTAGNKADQSGTKKGEAARNGAGEDNPNGKHAPEPTSAPASFQEYRIDIFPPADFSQILQNERFLGLPVEALRTTPATVQTLHQLGITRVGQLLQLPRSGLVARLGPELVKRLDQAIGKVDEVIVARHKPVEFHSAVSIEHPTGHRETIQTILTREIHRVCEQLCRQQQGALQVSCRFLCDSQYQRGVVDENKQLVSLRIGLFQPTAVPEHLLELLQMQLEHLDLPGCVHEVRVTVPQSSGLVQTQKHLFDDNPRDNPVALSQLVNRLSVRLGEENVLGFSLCRGAQPEHAYQYHKLASRLKRFRSPLGGLRDNPASLSPPKKNRRRNNSVAIASPFEHEASSSSNQTTAWQPRPLDRPLRLLPKPERLEAVSVTDGPPAFFFWKGSRIEIQTCWGPERIQTGWWRGPMTERDYWRVETVHGNRFWLFRELKQNRWYLHGTF